VIFVTAISDTSPVELASRKMRKSKRLRGLWKSNEVFLTRESAQINLSRAPRLLDVFLFTSRGRDRNEASGLPNPQVHANHLDYFAVFSLVLSCAGAIVKRSLAP
jgi:hypothetical protein